MIPTLVEPISDVLMGNILAKTPLQFLYIVVHRVSKVECPQTQQTNLVDGGKFLSRSEDIVLFSTYGFGVHNCPQSLKHCDDLIGKAPAHLAELGRLIDGWILRAFVFAKP
jgi:hypothetical protein